MRTFREVKDTIAVVGLQDHYDFNRPEKYDVLISYQLGIISSGSRTADVFFEIWKQVVIST